MRYGRPSSSAAARSTSLPAQISEGPSSSTSTSVPSADTRSHAGPEMSSSSSTAPSEARVRSTVCPPRYSVNTVPSSSSSERCSTSRTSPLSIVTTESQASTSIEA